MDCAFKYLSSIGCSALKVNKFLLSSRQLILTPCRFPFKAGYFHRWLQGACGWFPRCYRGAVTEVSFQGMKGLQHSSTFTRLLPSVFQEIRASHGSSLLIRVNGGTRILECRSWRRHECPQCQELLGQPLRRWTEDEEDRTQEGEVKWSETSKYFCLLPFAPGYL